MYHRSTIERLSSCWLMCAAISLFGCTDDTTLDDAGDTGSDVGTDTESMDTTDATEGTDTGAPSCADEQIRGDLPITILGDNTHAGNDSNGCVEPLEGLDVTYTWVAPADGVYAIDTFGTAYDTVLYVEDGLCRADAPLGCNDDTQGEQSRVALALFAGQQVMITVDGFNADDVGPFVLNIDRTSCPEPTDIGSELPHTEIGVLERGHGEITGSCGGQGNELVFAWTAPIEGSYVFDTFGSSFDAVVYLKDGPCGSELDCSDDAGGVQPQVSAFLRTGQTVTIVLDAFTAEAGGSYSLNISAG